MSIYNDIIGLVTVAPSYPSPPTGVQLPYVTTDPLLVQALEIALYGGAIDWDFQFSVHCCAASAEASYNLAILVMAELQGARVAGTTLSTSMGYSGAAVEGHYESQVTVQLNQGGI